MDVFAELKIILGGIKYEAKRVRDATAEYRAQRAAGIDIHGNEIDEDGMAWLDRQIAAEEPRIKALRQKYDMVRRRGY